MTTALIMAGGRGDRMARSGSTVPKPLVRVGGVSLLERNLQQLVRSGVGRVRVAVAADDAPVRDVVRRELRSLGDATDIEVDEVVETTPLGNIGAAGLCAGDVDTLLVVYADNLTCLDLREVVEHHRSHQPDLTLAAHREPFRMPFGELRADDRDRLVAYTEKPTYEILVGSGIMVLGPGALARIPTDAPTGIADLAQGLVDDGGAVQIMRHDAPWIDVNDTAAARRAEQLVAQHGSAFDTWLPDPVEHWRLLVDPRAVVDDDAFDVDGSFERFPHVWCRAGSIDDRADLAGAAPFATFDVVDARTSRRVRALVSLVTEPDALEQIAGEISAEGAPDVSALHERVVARVRATSDWPNRLPPLLVER